MATRKHMLVHAPGKKEEKKKKQKIQIHEHMHICL